MFGVSNVSANRGAGGLCGGGVRWYIAEARGATVGTVASSDGYCVVDHGEKEGCAVVGVVVEPRDWCRNKECKVVDKTLWDPGQS